MLDDFAAIAFPHSYLGEEGAKQALSLFDSVVVCVPWYAAIPGHVKGSAGIEVKHPPESLKPGGEFLHLLAEYKAWIAQHAERSLVEFFKVSKVLASGEDNTWHIRKSLREMVKAREPRCAGSPSLRWHMVLHLARDLEEQRDEADQALKGLRERRSPLDGVLEDESELKDLFEDIPRFSQEPAGEGYRVEPLLEAWTGLFGGHLGEGDFLVTMNPGVMDALSELREELGGPDNPPGGGMLTFRWPDLSSLDFDEISKARQDMMKNDQLRRMRTLFMAMGEDPQGAMGALQEEASKLSLEGDAQAFQVSLRYLRPHLLEGGPLEAGKLKSLGGKVLVLISG